MDVPHILYCISYLLYPGKFVNLLEFIKCIFLITIYLSSKLKSFLCTRDCWRTSTLELLLLLGRWETYLVMRLWKISMIYPMTRTLSGRIYWCCFLWLLHTKLLFLFCWSFVSGKTSLSANFSCVTKIQWIADRCYTIENHLFQIFGYYCL